MKRIAALDGVPRDDELKIRERAGKLNAGVSFPVGRFECNLTATADFLSLARICSGKASSTERVQLRPRRLARRRTPRRTPTAKPLPPLARRTLCKSTRRQRRQPMARPPPRRLPPEDQSDCQKRPNSQSAGTFNSAEDHSSPTITH